MESVKSLRHSSELRWPTAAAPIVPLPVPPSQGSAGLGLRDYGSDNKDNPRWHHKINTSVGYLTDCRRRCYRADESAHSRCEILVLIRMAVLGQISVLPVCALVRRPRTATTPGCSGTSRARSCRCPCRCRLCFLHLARCIRLGLLAHPCLFPFGEALARDKCQE
jgi:hypothetical protein